MKTNNLQKNVNAGVSLLLGIFAAIIALFAVAAAIVIGLAFWALPAWIILVVLTWGGLISGYTLKTVVALTVVLWVLAALFRNKNKTA